MLTKLTPTKQSINSNQKKRDYPYITPSSSIFMVLINDRKAYIPVSSCIINFIVQTSDLNSSEKLFYLLVTIYAKLNYSINCKRTAEKSGKEWGRLLNRSEQHIFQMQKKLESLGYFLILREKDADNQNEKNIITPTLPDKIFDELIKEPNRAHLELTSFCEEEEYKLSYLDNSKMFIKLNLSMFHMVLQNNSLSSLQKLIWVYFFYRSYIAYNNKNGNGTRDFITNYQEISTIFACNESTISVAVNRLEAYGFITKKQFRIKDQTKFSRRKKKSCWEICALLPEQQMKELLQQKDRQNLSPLTLDDCRLYDSSWTTNKNTSYYMAQSKCSYFYSAKPSQPIEFAKSEQAINYNNFNGNSCNLNNSYVIEADSYETMQYNNKNNILDIKNNVTDREIGYTNSSMFKASDVNVFSEKELLVSDDELSKGLNIAARFEAETFLKPQKNLANLEEVIKQVDGTFTTGEHWLVTKTAFTLHQKLQTEVLSKYGLKYDDDVVTKLKEQLFTPVEERLISLWESFSDVPDKSQQEEFLIRKSWLLRLIPNYSVRLKNNQMTQHAPIVKDPSLDLTIPDLPGDKADKAKKFAKKLLTNKLAKGYSSSLSIDDLAKELIYHAANWIPARLNCKSREEQIDAALSVAWKAIEKGIWQCPYRLLNMQIQQRELESVSWKSL